MPQSMAERYSRERGGSTSHTAVVRSAPPGISTSTSLFIQNLATSNHPNLSPSAAKRYSQIFAEAARYARRGFKVPSYLVASTLDLMYGLYDHIITCIRVLQHRLDRYPCDTMIHGGGDGRPSGSTDAPRKTYINADVEMLYRRIEANVGAFKRDYARLAAVIAETLRRDLDSETGGCREGLASSEFDYVFGFEEVVRNCYYRESEVIGKWEPIAKTVADALEREFWAQGDRILGL